MAIVSLSEVTRSYGARTVLNGVSLGIEPGERVGLLGANGSGKSSLAKILAGLEPPDTGTVATRRDANVLYLQQEPVFAPGLTAFQAIELGLARWQSALKRYHELTEQLSAQNVMSQALVDAHAAAAGEVELLGGWDVSHKIHTFIQRLGIAGPDALVDKMSGGERRRVALARILVEAPTLAVLDEPTNHLDPETVEWLEDYLVDEFAGSILLVTHDRYVLDRVVTRIIELDRGKATSFEGNYRTYLQIREDRAAADARDEATRQNTLRIERNWLSRQAPARTTKQKARILRAIELESQAKEAQVLRRGDGTANFELASVHGAKRLLTAEGLTKQIAGRTLFEGVDLFVQNGERIGIVGPNGAGKTTLARVLLGQLESDGGTITLTPSAVPRYLDQNRVDLDEDGLVIDAVSDGGDRVRVGDQWLRVESWLQRFMFGPDKLRQRVSSLSGGERARLALARLMRGEANLLVLDEPTNDLDLPTLAVLEELILNFDGAVLVITHDRAFLDRVATHTLAFEPGPKVVRYAGGYEDYRAQRALREERESQALRDASANKDSVRPAQSATEEPKGKRGRKGLSFAEQRELEAIPERIDLAEQSVQTTASALEDPTLYSRGAESIAAAQAAHAQAQAQLEQLMARWEVLETRKSES
ncbi:MAG: ABC-F family ATP-binding cassette domain-containing protein [Deltaproteobacteria bacterium]|nr:ABC-F family ATP-binding cassette domain-containing protein [Deltaproteobacteria bacterium]